jgi:hypothetical protein
MEVCGPVQACNGIDLHLPLPSISFLIRKLFEGLNTAIQALWVKPITAALCTANKVCSCNHQMFV